MAAIANPASFTPLNFSSHLKELPLVNFGSVRPSLRISRLSRLKCTRNVSNLHVIRAQSSPDYIPDSKFYKVEAILRYEVQVLVKLGLLLLLLLLFPFFPSPLLSSMYFFFHLLLISGRIRPWRVQQALLNMGIRGVTVSDVRGFGAQGGSTERHGGSEFSEDKFVAKVKMEIVVSKDQVEGVIDKIMEEARTGEIGDGKIFLVPVSDVIRVRTGERGEKAERMAGGWSDISSAV
ncbi:hypothetical protein CUMW_085410 [Citrus unshiu]|nr:hypothetical protein CUMW_085410 [Citrus unshiu]